MRTTPLLLLAAVAPAQTPEPATPAPIRALVVAGANNHDWEWTTPVLGEALAETGRFAVRTTVTPGRDLADPAVLAATDVIVLNYHGPRWGEPAERAFLAAVERGVGVTVVHAANNAFPGWIEYEKLVGLCWRQGTGHGHFHPYDVEIVDHYHPITQGMEKLRLHPDELYHRLVHMHGAEFRVLLSSYADPKTGGSGRWEPMATAGAYGKGRVFHTPLGHVWSGQLPTRASVLDPQFRRLLARGTEWAATGAVTLDPRPLNWLSAEEAAQGFELLFDGRTMAGWRGYRQEGPPAQGWVVQDAALVHRAQGGGGDLVSAARYGQFDFRFSFRVAPQANSGVMFWVQEDQEQSYMTGPEYQVLDDAAAGPAPAHGTGALYDLVAPPADKPLRPAGAWNSGRILLQNGRLGHWLNGVQVVDVAIGNEEWQALVAGSKFQDWPFGRVAEGHLCLQDHGDEVAFRDLRIRKL